MRHQDHKTSRDHNFTLTKQTSGEETKSHYILGKGKTQQEEITVENRCSSNTGAPIIIKTNTAEHKLSNTNYKDIRIEITACLLSDCCALKLEISHIKNYRKCINTWRLITHH